MTLPNGVVIQWNGIKMVKIQVPPSQMNQVCGICGNFDGNNDNDGDGVEEGDLFQGFHNNPSYSDCHPKLASGPFGAPVCPCLDASPKPSPEMTTTANVLGLL